jgi:hypothetical protein
VIERHREAKLRTTAIWTRWRRLGRRRVWNRRRSRSAEAAASNPALRKTSKSIRRATSSARLEGKSADHEQALQRRRRAGQHSDPIDNPPGLWLPHAAGRRRPRRALTRRPLPTPTRTVTQPRFTQEIPIYSSSWTRPWRPRRCWSRTSSDSARIVAGRRDGRPATTGEVWPAALFARLPQTIRSKRKGARTSGSLSGESPGGVSTPRRSQNRLC